MGKRVNQHVRPVDGRSPPDAPGLHLRVLSNDGETASLDAALEAATEALKSALAALDRARVARRAALAAEAHPAPTGEFLTVAEVGERLRIGRTGAYQLVSRGELETVRIGRTVRVPAASLARFIATHTAQPRNA